MDPFTIMMGIGAITSAAGSIGGIFGSSKSNEANQAIANLQMQQNAVRRQAMEVSARRQQTENLRNTQLQRSMAINAATNQGAQFGTGLAGGVAQVQSTGGWNANGISQNLDFGRQMFGLDDQINIQKQNLASSQTQQATFQGISALGSNIMGASGKFGQMAQGFGGGNNSGMQLNTYGDFVKSINSNGIY